MKKILAIDDQPDNLITIKAVLKSNIPDCTVITANSGKEGIEIAQQQQPDVILLDIIMPGMDGYQTCEFLKTDVVTKHIPVVLVTAIKTDAQSRAKGLNMGADAFVAKPIEAVELTAQVNVMLRIKAAEDQLRNDKYELEIEIRKRTFELKESEERYKALYENAPLPFQSLNEEGTIVDINPTWLSVMGYQQEEVLGKWYGDFLHPDYQPIFTKNFPVLKTCGSVKDVPFRLRKKDGSYILISLNGQSGYFPDGTFKQTYCVFEDITERIIALEKLKKSEEQKSIILQTTLEGFWIVDKDGYFNVVNDSYCKLIGYSRKELLSMSVSDVELIDSANDVKQRIERIAFTGHESFESQHIKKDGSIVDVLVSINYLSSDQLYFVFVHDITERKKYEKTLKKLSTAVEQSPSIIVITDLKGYFEYTNPRYCEITGYSPAELVGESTAILKSGKQTKEVYKELWETIKSGKDWRGEFQNKKKNGELFWESVSISPIFNTKGEIVNYIKVAEDITERKKAESALRESEYKFRLIFENSPIGIYIGDTNGNILDGNPSLIQIMGSPSIEATKGINVLKFPPLVQNGYAEKYLKCIETEMPIEFEMPYKTKWGKDIYLRSFVVPLRNTNGKIEHIYTLIEDITDRKRSEKVQQILFNISDAALSSISLKKLYHNIQQELGRIIDTTNIFIGLINKTTQKLEMQYYADEHESTAVFPEGKTISSYVIKTKKPLLANKKDLDKMFEDGIIDRFGVDSQIWLGVPLKIDKEIIGVLVVQSYHNPNAYTKEDKKLLEFVSEQISQAIYRKKTEADLMQALEKATESDRLKSTFLATMSHELRTPLNAIIGFSDIIDETLAIDEVVSYNKIINTSGNHLLSIVDDLFDISLIETGEVKTFKQEVDLKTVLEDILRMMKIEQQDNQKQNIDLKLILPDEDKPRNLLTDANKLKQIFINLIKNALKFTKTGYVHFGYFIQAKGKNNHLVFYVKDSGIGINKSKQHSIFNMFEQIEDPRTRVYGGTGIGLSVAKRLTHLLGGEIWVESEPAKGSEFYISFPIN